MGALSCKWDSYLEGGFGSWAPLNGGDSQAFFWAVPPVREGEKKTGDLELTAPPE